MSHGPRSRAFLGGRLLGAVLCLALALPALPQEGGKSPAPPPEAEKIGEDLYRIGKVKVDLKAKALTCSGKINMSKGTIEYLAVVPRGKRHESVLLIDVHPLHFQVGLILLGLEPKGGLSRTDNPRKTQGTPKGSPVDVWASWQRGGRSVRVTGEELAWDLDRKAPMQRNAWVFSGSTGGFSGFVAEEDLSLIATYRDPVAVINNALPTGLDDTVYKVNERLVPPVGTPVTLAVFHEPGEVPPILNFGLRFHPFRDNPVFLHSGRLVARSGGIWAVLLLLLGAGILGALLQQYWMELGIYNLLRPYLAVRWLGLALIAQTMVVLPWAAVRGALLWRRLQSEGHLDEYRRSRLCPAVIAAGMPAAVVNPVWMLLVMSLGLALLVGGLTAGLSPLGAAQAHLLLAAQSVAFAALGLWLAGRLYYPAAAIPVALGLLAAAIGAIGCLNPFYRAMAEPSAWIYVALLPNPVTAVGNALDTDVLRFSWIYEHVRAHEYFYVYPPVWQTAGLYLAGALVGLGMLKRRIARETT